MVSAICLWVAVPSTGTALRKSNWLRTFGVAMSSMACCLISVLMVLFVVLVLPVVKTHGMAVVEGIHIRPLAEDIHVL